jgi:hypothetical protein
MAMYKYLVALLLLSTVACNDKKKSLSGNEPLTFEQFSDAFVKLELPFIATDSNFSGLGDTSTISSDIFRRFVPDTTLQSMIVKDSKISLHPVGKIEAKDEETYLVILVSGKQKKALHLVVFKNKVFSASMPLLVGNKDDVTDKTSIDKKLSIVISKEWYDKNDLKYNRTIYAYNNAGVFTTVLTETNEKRTLNPAAVINPLDTFPKKNKYSGDYVKGKNNILSIRDGRTPNDYLFFIYFVNDGEDACGGNLKGEIKLTSEKAGIYNQGGDPCVIDFTFNKNEVKVKEQGSCGNYRGITCFFDHTFTRKKEAKATTRKSKS